MADNNIFDSIEYPVRNAPGIGGSSWWDNFSLTFGAPDNNFYYEDNTFSDVSIVSDCQCSGRYAFRYNSITTHADAYPLFDMHGNQPFGTNATGALLGMYSTFGGEIYGNKINEGGHGMDLLCQRGGKVLVFNNRVDGSGGLSIQTEEECPDSQEPTSNPQPQHVSDSYFWNNRWKSALVYAGLLVSADRTAAGGGSNYLNYNGSGLSWTANQFFGEFTRYGVIVYAGTAAGQARNITAATTTTLTVSPGWNVVPDTTSKFRIVNDHNGNTIHENSEFFNYGPSFSGSAAVNTLDGPALANGMGCGPLASHPATCTPGVAYWATDQDFSSVSDDNIGVHPKTPVAGTLYKCTAPNVWTAYYTPLAYPHPLRVSGPVADAPSGISSKPTGPRNAFQSKSTFPVTIVRAGRDVFIRVSVDGAERITITSVSGRTIAAARVPSGQGLLQLGAEGSPRMSRGIYLAAVAMKNGTMRPARLIIE